MAPKIWTVDASAMGTKGMHWRTHIGSGQFLTRTGDDAPGFARNGTRFEGEEEQPGWVHNLATDRWLPLWDGPGYAAQKAPDTTSLKEIAAAPAGRSLLARTREGKAIPYLHIADDCGCGGRWCKSLPQPPPLEVEATVLRPRRAAREKVEEPPAMRPTAPRPQSRKWSPFSIFLVVWFTTGVALYLSNFAFQPETMEERFERSLSSRVPPLHTVLGPIMQARGKN